MSTGADTQTTRNQSSGAAEMAAVIGATTQFEYLDCKELAERWKLPESWIRDQVRSRADDPIPHLRFGKYVRFRWGSPELEDWALRRIVGAPNNRAVGRVSRKEGK